MTGDIFEYEYAEFIPLFFFLWEGGGRRLLYRVVFNYTYRICFIQQRKSIYKNKTPPHQTDAPNPQTIHNPTPHAAIPRGNTPSLPPAAPVKLTTPLPATPVELATGLPVATRAKVLPPITTSEAEGARLNAVPLIVRAGPPGERVWPAMMNSD